MDLPNPLIKSLSQMLEGKVRQLICVLVLTIRDGAQRYYAMDYRH